MLLELFNSLAICFVQPPPPYPLTTTSQSPPPLPQIITEFLLASPPPNHLPESKRLFLFLSSPPVRPLLLPLFFANFILSPLLNLLSSLYGLSHHTLASAAAAAAAAATGSIGAAFTVATGSPPSPPLPTPLTTSHFTPPSPPSAFTLPLSLLAYGCVLNAGRRMSPKRAGAVIV
jgi:hypothetical protein